MAYNIIDPYGLGQTDGYDGRPEKREFPILTDQADYEEGYHEGQIKRAEDEEEERKREEADIEEERHREEMHIEELIQAEEEARMEDLIHEEAIAPDYDPEDLDYS